MTKIYLVRHCEALGNIMRIFQGTTDLDISELGQKQLQCLEERFKSIKLDKVISSPLLRTRKTAEAIKGNRNIKIQIEQDLIELDGGIVEGKPFQETFASLPILKEAWNNHPEDFAPQDGETMQHAYERIWNVIIKIAKENKNSTVACATHGGVLRCLTCRLLYNDIKQLKNTIWAENTAVALIEFDNEFNPHLVFYNDMSHLPEELINRKSRIVGTIKDDEK